MLIPNIQLFAEGNADPANANGGNNNGGTDPNGGAPITYTQEQLDTIVNERTGRATKSALSSFFKQKGLSEEDANKAIDAYLEQKAKNTPDVTQLKNDLVTANSKVTETKIELKAQLEAIKHGVNVEKIPYVLKMANLKNCTDENGEINNEKVTEAITKVLDDIPELKNTAQSEGNNGITKIGGDGNNKSGDVGDEVLRGIFGIKSK